MLVSVSNITVMSVAVQTSKPNKDGNTVNFVSVKGFVDGYVRSFWGFEADFETLPVATDLINVTAWVSAKKNDDKAYLTFQLKSWNK